MVEGGAQTATYIYIVVPVYAMLNKLFYSFLNIYHFLEK
jgi:hypothetical protein